LLLDRHQRGVAAVSEPVDVLVDLVPLTKTYDVGAGIATPDGTMCKLTKTDSAVLSLYLETQYVNEIAERGYAVPSNLDRPAAARPKLSR